MDSGSSNHVISFIVSDCLHHDAIAVYLFQKNLITFLKKQCSTTDKVIYFSDGAASQCINRKNLINLCHHQADFGIKAEWYSQLHLMVRVHVRGLVGQLSALKPELVCIVPMNSR